MAVSTTIPSSTHTTSRNTGLHIGLWVAQIALALAFGMAGFTKVSTPIAELAQMMPFVADTPAALVRFIGVAELAGALGLLLPGMTRIKPSLTAWAALGLVVVMGLAALLHLSRGELGAVPVNLVLVTWGRFRAVPLSAAR